MLYILHIVMQRMFFTIQVCTCSFETHKMQSNDSSMDRSQTLTSVTNIKIVVKNTVSWIVLKKWMHLLAGMFMNGAVRSKSVFCTFDEAYFCWGVQVIKKTFKGSRLWEVGGSGMCHSVPIWLGPRWSRFYFRFRPSNAKWIGIVLPNRQNAAIRSMFFFPPS